MEEPKMKLPIRENKVNWNTVISAAGFAIMIAVYAVSFGEFRAGVSETNRNLEDLEANVQQWRTSHMDYHRERATQLDSSTARMDERVNATERRLQDMATLTHRVTVLEQGAASLTKSVADLNSAMSVISGDIRVIRESLLRLERSSEQLRPSSMAATQ